jgi:DNA polymerase elongation subunit (family B)
MDFDSISDAREFIKKYNDVGNFNIYGSTLWPYVFIFDRYQHCQYDPKEISVGNFDIEVYAPEFPDPYKANWPVSAITIEKNGKIYALGMKPFQNNDPDVTYILCLTEEELLAAFIELWVKLDFDVVTGWNIDFFDIPYLVNRIRKILGDDYALFLSPWKKIEERSVKQQYGGEKLTYDLVGITSLDYLPLYKKFSFGNEESYTLNNIASVVVGEKKLDYSEYESLADLYERNFQLYLEYNIRDVKLVTKIDQKLGFIQQVFAIAYDSCVNFADTFTSVKIWEIIMHNYLLGKNIVSPQKTKSEKEKQIAGGFVKEPIPGRYIWPVSFDLDSLYPHLIMQYNISPETLVDTLDELPSNESSPVRLLEGFMTPERTAQLKAANLSLTAGGALYSNEKQGFVPYLMERMYEDRKTYKTKMLAAKDDLVAIEAEMKKRGLKL